MTITTPTSDREQRLAWAVEAVEEMPSLPSPETLAAPIVAGLLGLHDAQPHDRVSALIDVIEAAEFEPSVDVDRYRAELRHMVDTFERVAQIVRAAVSNLVPGSPTPGLTDGCDRVIRSIGCTMPAEQVLDGTSAAVQALIGR